MHIEPGVVDGAKMIFAYGTGVAAAAYTVKLVLDDTKWHAVPSLVVRSILATLAAVIFFEILPHFSVGISEVHFILGTSLLLLLGVAPAAIGLSAGLLIQGLFMAPTDLPMYFVNLTTLLVPLFAIDAIAKRIVPISKPYVDLDFGEVLKLSAVYQGGVVAWVAFWAFYGQGFGVETMAAVGSFAVAYSVVLLVEPIADLALLAGAKALRSLEGSSLVTPRLYSAG